MSAPEAGPALAREAAAQYRAAVTSAKATEVDWELIARTVGTALSSVLAQPGDPHWIVIGAGWRTTLGQLLRDGIDWNRQFTDESCQACAADPYSQCEAHEEYLGQIGFYRSLAREMGIEVRR